MVNILIADDNLTFCKILVNKLTKNKNVRICKICTNGKEILNILDTEQIDIILLDIIMPECNGLEVLNYLLKTNKEIYKNSIIVISGEAKFMAQLVDNPLVFDYVLKGSSYNVIERKLNVLIENKNISAKKAQILNELTTIGYDINYKGTIYLIEVIIQMYIYNRYD